MSVKVIASLGAFSHLAQLYPDRKAIVMIHAQAEQSLLAHIRELMRGRLCDLIELPDGMPEVSEVEAHQKSLWGRIDEKSMFLVAIGGGSVMDTAKTIRFAPTPEVSLAMKLDRPMLQASTYIPLVLCPTTAGTGSEVTSTATLWDFSAGRKHSFFGDPVYADVAIVDPSLTISANESVTRSAAIDALSHALESIWNLNRNPTTISLAVSAAQNILTALPSALKDPYDVHARELLSFAALWSGQAMAVTQTSLAHALSYQDTIDTRLSHGLAVGKWLPLVYQRAREHDTAISPYLRRALGPTITSAKELALWLECIGIETVDPYSTSKEIERRFWAALSSTRGRNFSGRVNERTII